MCCTWLAENTGRKNDAKNRHLGTIPQLCRANSPTKLWDDAQMAIVDTCLSCEDIARGYIFATKACIDNWKKIVKQQYLLHT